MQSNKELQARVNELNVLYSTGKSVAQLMPMDQLLRACSTPPCRRPAQRRRI